MTLNLITRLKHFIRQIFSCKISVGPDLPLSPKGLGKIMKTTTGGTAATSFCATCTTCRTSWRRLGAGPFPAERTMSGCRAPWACCRRRRMPCTPLTRRAGKDQSRTLLVRTNHALGWGEEPCLKGRIKTAC